MNTQSFDEILTKMMNHMIANQDQLNDFNEGSMIRTMFESIARIGERLYIDTRNGYSNNLKAIPYSIFDFKKKTGAKASTTVKFQRAKPLPTKTIIPVGTQVSNGTYYFYTTAVGAIDAGAIESGAIPVVADKVGIAYNVTANALTTIESSVSSDIVSVNNEIRASGGTDDETELQMLSRFKTYINGLQGTNPYGFKSTILAIEGVRSVSIVEQFPPLLNIYNAIVYVDDGTGNLNDELKQKIEDAINGNDTAVQPGCRATGMQVFVQGASPVNIKLSVKVKVYRTDDDTAKFDVKEALVEEINNLHIGESIIISSLILKLRRISYVKDVSELLIEGSERSENYDILENQIARISAGDINVEVITI